MAILVMIIIINISWAKAFVKQHNLSALVIILSENNYRVKEALQWTGSPE
jgi:hypothetical protein